MRDEGARNEVRACGGRFDRGKKHGRVWVLVVGQRRTSEKRRVKARIQHPEWDRAYVANVAPVARSVYDRRRDQEQPKIESWRGGRVEKREISRPIPRFSTFYHPGQARNSAILALFRVGPKRSLEPIWGRENHGDTETQNQAVLDSEVRSQESECGTGRQGGC